MSPSTSCSRIRAASRPPACMNHWASPRQIHPSASSSRSTSAAKPACPAADTPRWRTAGIWLNCQPFSGSSKISRVLRSPTPKNSGRKPTNSGAASGADRSRIHRKAAVGLFVAVNLVRLLSARILNAQAIPTPHDLAACDKKVSAARGALPNRRRERWSPPSINRERPVLATGNRDLNWFRATRA